VIKSEINIIKAASYDIHIDVLSIGWYWRGY